MFCAMLKNLPKGEPLETRLSPKKVNPHRRTAAKNKKNPKGDGTRAKKRRCLIRSSKVSVNSDCEEGTILNNGSEESPDKKKGIPQLLVVPHVERITEDEENEEINSFCTPSSKANSNRKASSKLNYGSEKESDEEEEEGIMEPIVVPRVARMFMTEEDEKINSFTSMSSKTDTNSLCELSTIKLNHGSEKESDEEEEEVMMQPIVVPRVARIFMSEEDEKINSSPFMSSKTDTNSLCELSTIILNHGSNKESVEEEFEITQSVVATDLESLFKTEKVEKIKDGYLSLTFEVPILPTSSICTLKTASPKPAPPMPASPMPASPTPASATPASPTPASPKLASPTPGSPTPTLPTPASPTPTLPTPDSLTPASPKLASPTPASPTPTLPTPASPTPTLPTPASPTPDSPTPASPKLASPTPASTNPIEPSNKFKFEWRAFSMPQIEPHLRREPFTQINTGPTVSFTSPYEAFTAIWNREIMEVIVRETNIYAKQLTSTMLKDGAICPNSRINRWQDTNVDELYVYFAIILAMGVVVKSRLEEYWNTPQDIFITPSFSTEMRYNRFHLLSKCLHFNNNENCNPALLTRPQARLFKVQPVIDHLNVKFSQLYNLSQNVALDESLTMWKGWLDINQFIPNKVAAVGIKTYELCESQTGYLWRFEVHTGQDTSALQDDDPVSGITPALVLRILNGLEHKGHTIWMDNFYNSPALARELKIRGFDCVGTLRTNRKFVPTELASVQKSDMVVGQVYGCTSGDVDLMLWRDKNRVAFISTYHGLAISKCGDTLKPTVVQDYNVCMGGVDRKDQILAMYPIERKRSTVWYKKFFRRLLNVSVLNSYILLKNQSLTHRKFRRILITDLLTRHRPPGLTSPNPCPTSYHSPAQYDIIKPGKSSRFKRNCAVCKKRTITYCKTCNVPMCVFTCHEPYHTNPKNRKK